MRVLFWAGFWSFLIDQATKYWMVHLLDLSRVHRIDVFPPLLNLRYGENTGINFGLFGDSGEASRWILIALSLAICVGVAVWLIRSRHGFWMQLSAGLLIGGALGNVIDRLLYGYVIDFLNTSCCGINNPFVFNVADIFIFAGAIGLILFEGRSKPTAKKAS